jgi:hypothetical protein
VINNDYVKGYFDAHGRIWVRDKKRTTPQWCIEFQDKDTAQIMRVYDYLVQQGYIAHFYTYKEECTMGKTLRNRIQIGHRHEVMRFIKEVGSERPEWQERFTQI